MLPLENKQFVAQIFEELRQGNHRALLSRVAKNSTWTITGSSPVSGTFHSRQEFYENALARITRKLTARVVPTVTRLIAEGDTVVVLWHGESTSRDGMAYNNQYCWVLKIENSEIQEGIIYADTKLISDLLEVSA